VIADRREVALRKKWIKGKSSLRKKAGGGNSCPYLECHCVIYLGKPAAALGEGPLFGSHGETAEERREKKAAHEGKKAGKRGNRKRRKLREEKLQRLM